MSEDRERALMLSLKAVLIAAGRQGLNVDALTEAAIDELLRHKDYDSAYVPAAINEIEVAADAVG
ncbi:hypothetical protein N5D61_02685 [Pseudomonas sp. GD03842]|uniref:hypothetical protein n=1 Tax=Pseudomonas sp. GD03842 TaxID=2975385 RepID=UPI0024495196|nr:hypothetical protein [Pseudomonas sp. GD03842]MDH0745249.1 hypothetical protein [Pseudomonas sp. GD03842]